MKSKCYVKGFSIIYKTGCVSVVLLKNFQDMNNSTPPRALTSEYRCRWSENIEICYAIF